MVWVKYDDKFMIQVMSGPVSGFKSTLSETLFHHHLHFLVTFVEWEICEDAAAGIQHRESEPGVQ